MRGCSLYAAPDKKYCFYHLNLEGLHHIKLDSAAKKKKETQVEVFERLWEERPHVCFVTGQSLNRWKGTKFFPSVFAHILRKSSFKEYRTNPDNIVFLSPNYKGHNIHDLFDNAVLSKIKKFESETGKSFRGLFDLEQSIYDEYVSAHGNKTPPRKIMSAYLE